MKERLRNHGEGDNEGKDRNNQPITAREKESS